MWSLSALARIFCSTHWHATHKSQVISKTLPEKHSKHCVLEKSFPNPLCFAKWCFAGSSISRERPNQWSSEASGVWKKNARGASSTSIPLLYTVGQVCRLSLTLGGQVPGQLTPFKFDFRMFKIITRAKGNPAKRSPLVFQTRGWTHRVWALYHWAEHLILIMVLSTWIAKKKFVAHKTCWGVVLLLANSGADSSNEDMTLRH